jgi:hypothetical protein
VGISKQIRPAPERNAAISWSAGRWCISCLALGHTCAATHSTENGDAVCVFCLDSAPCPYLQRKRRGVGREKLEEEQMPEEPTMETSTEIHEAGPARICAKPDCGTPLSAMNKSGKCAKHFHWNEAPKARPNATIKAPAEGNETSGHATDIRRPTAIDPRVREDRINQLIVSWSLADKTRIVQAWLAGEL